MQHCFWAHDPGSKVCDSLFVLGANTFCSGSETRRRLAQHTSVDQQSADGIADLKFGDLLPNDRIGRVGHLAGMQVQRPVRNQTVDSPALMFKLTHRLRKRISLNANKISDRHSYVVKPHFIEVTSIDHVPNRSDFNSRGVHWHDNFADTQVRFVGNRLRATDQIAIVRFMCERCPDFLSVNDPLIAVANRRSRQ